MAGERPKNKENSRIRKEKIQKQENSRGITLIALVITIVILIILATVAMSFVFGEDGLISRAQQAAEMSEITSILEAMELAKGESLINGKGTIDPDDFFNILERDEIIEDKETDVVDNEDGTYNVTTKGDYEFIVTLTPEGDLEIEYIGKGEGPRIININIEKTTSSVTVEVEARNAEGATYTYSYKKNSEGEESWIEAEKSKNNTCTINGLEENEIYNIKVKVETNKGTAERTVNVHIGEMPQGTIRFEDYVWQGDGTASVVVKTEETGYTLQYQKNGIEGEWTEINSGETITGLKYGDTVYARLWDGTNESEHASVTIEDKTVPQVEVVLTGGSASNSIGIKVTATDRESGMANSITYTYYIKQSGEADTAYVAKASDIAENIYTFTGLTQGTSYDVKVEVTGDVAGNTGTGYLRNQTTESIPGGETGVEQGAIKFGNTTWSEGSASIVVSTNTSYSIEYQVNGIAEGNWTGISNNGSITGLKHGNTVYARLTDGTNAGDYANATIEDKLIPQAATIDLSGTTTDTEESVTATITMADNESGVDATGSKWVYNTTSTNIGTDEASYTNSFTTNPEQITLQVATAGTYYLHVLTKDVAGNKVETISEAITVEEAKSDVEEAIKDGNIFEETTQITDEQGNKVTIPEGFKVAEDSGNTVQQGIVIEDAFSTDANVKGSQYVWIPVGKFTKDDGTESNEIVLGRYTFDANGKTTLQQAAYTIDSPENYKTSKAIESYYSELATYREGVASSGTSGKNATAYNLEAWINSVKENGGYYIGRYEASYASGSNTEDYKAASKISTGYSISSMSYTPRRLWNWITQLDASKVAINTYKDSNNGVKSDLMNSYAWDTAIVYIQEAGNTNYANKTSVNSSLSNTGTNNDEVCKINDMASNCYEWTTEYSSNATSYVALPSVTRGGGYYDSSYYTAYRSSYYATYSHDGYSFRLTLYIE